MDPFHARLARVALAAAERYSFALAGGYAVQAHGFLDRPSADVDIFTTSRAEGDFAAAVDAVLAALKDDGLVSEAEIRNTSFARIAVAIPTGGTTKIEMGVDWRANQPSRSRSALCCTLMTRLLTRSARSSAGRRFVTTSMLMPSCPVAGMARRNYSTSPRLTIRASTGSGSPRRWPPSTDYPTTGSGSTTSPLARPTGSRRGLQT